MAVVGRKLFRSRFPLSVATCLVAVVACGPSQDHATIEVLPKGPLGKAIGRCSDQLRGKTKIVGSLDSETGLNVAICEIKPDSENDQKSYRMVNYPIRYRVTNQGGRLIVGLNIGVHLPEDMPRRTRVEVGNVLRDQCLSQLQNVWASSLKTRSTDLRIELASYPVDPQTEKKIDQSLAIISAPEGSRGDSKEENPSFLLAAWPEEGVLYPYGRAEDKKACSKMASEAEKTECLSQRKFLANQNFCAAFAIRMVQWLGLTPDAELQKRCVDPEHPGDWVVEEQTADPQSRTVLSDSFTQIPHSTKPTGKNTWGKAFWENAKFSVTDIKTILSPACSAFDGLTPKDMQ